MLQVKVLQSNVTQVKVKNVLIKQIGPFQNNMYHVLIIIIDAFKCYQSW